MVDLIPILSLAVFFTLLFNRKIVLTMKNNSGISFIRMCYLGMVLLGGVFCLISSIGNMDLSVLFYGWIFFVLALNLVGMLQGVKNFKKLKAQDIIFATLSVTLVIIIFITSLLCISENEKDLSAIMILAVGSGIVSFLFMFSVCQKYLYSKSC